MTRAVRGISRRSRASCRKSTARPRRGWRRTQGPAGRARAVADYIAGMTDRYAILEHRRLFDPSERPDEPDDPCSMTARSRTICCCAPCCASRRRAGRSGSCARRAGICRNTARRARGPGSFLAMCTNPEIACEVTLQPRRSLSARCRHSVLRHPHDSPCDESGSGLRGRRGSEIRAAGALGRRHRQARRAGSRDASSGT